jgi:pyruvate dehydrogenase E2 component (dihydrolipoamide acetyltransferase)
MSSQGAVPTLKDVLSQHGDVETVPISRVQRLTARAMAHSWSTIPHVTHHDRIDVTLLDGVRRQVNDHRTESPRLTLVPYVLKAVACLLGELPRFGAAFDEASGQLIVRKYVNLGMAIDTPTGLIVGVVHGCDRLSVEDIAAETRALGEKARGKGLALAQMTGGTMTVSSLGALGGDGFTPIINAPEAAILGVGKMQETARRAADGSTQWAMVLPVSLSYDHRVLNGADAGRFMMVLQRELDRLSATE